MPELAEVQKPKTIVAHNKKNQSRIEQEEAELQRLMGGDEEDTQSAVKKVQETSEDEDQETFQEPEPESAEEKSFKKRYGDLRRHMQKKEKEWEERFEQLSKTQKIMTPPTSDEDVERWVNEHPQVAAIVKSLAKREAEERMRATEAQLVDLNEARDAANRLRAESLIRKSHPDFDDLRNSDEFHNWAEEQPKWVQDALYENADDAKSVVRVIDLYKVDMGMDTKSQKRKEKDVATDIKVGKRVKVEDEDTAVQWSESKVAKLSDKDFEKYEAEITNAMRTGKFKYDMSGGAR